MAAGSADQRAKGIAALIAGGGIFLGALILVPFVFVAMTLAPLGGTDEASGSETGTISCQNSNFKVRESGPIVTESPGEKGTATDKKYKRGSPKDYIPVYQAAAAHYKLGPEGPNYLSAIHKIETGYGSNVTYSTAGAMGHMQFMPATWQSYAVDVNDGKRNVWDPEDGIFGAARYLKASGAPGDWNGAVFAYNHAGWYVSEVTNDAKSFNIEPC